MQIGTRVHFISSTGLIDHSAFGTVTEVDPVSPDGERIWDTVEVRWEDDGEREILTLDDVISVADFARS